MLPALLGSRAGGQAPTTGPGPAEAVLVAAAESLGVKYTRTAPPDEPGANFRRTMAGTAERRCVEGRDSGPVRSGEFVIGGQLEGVFGLNPGLTRKIWWAPLHFARAMPSLVVSGRKLGGPSDTLVWSSRRIAWVTPQGATDPEYFFPSGFTVPSAGRWLLVASSGPNWGCFILTVTEGQPSRVGQR